MSIRLENVSHVYGRKTPNEHLALKNINLEIKEGEFVGLSAIPVRENRLSYNF